MSERISVLTEINDRIAREPFDSFLIVMTSSHRYRIEFAEEVIVGDEAIILIPLRGSSHSVLRLSEVCSVEVPHRKTSRRR